MGFVSGDMREHQLGAQMWGGGAAQDAERQVDRRLEVGGVMAERERALLDDLEGSYSWMCGKELRL